MFAAVDITALNIFLCLPLAPASARIFFFLLLLRNKVAILLHCLYKPSRILIFFLKESGTYLSFLAISNISGVFNEKTEVEEVPRGVAYILMQGRRGARQLETGNKVKVSRISFHVQTKL